MVKLLVCVIQVAIILLIKEQHYTIVAEKDKLRKLSIKTLRFPDEILQMNSLH